ncbi:MAG: type III secretion system chaperone, partial [Planctomycetota bacterium]
MLNDLVAQLGKAMGMDELRLDEDGFCTIGFDEAAEVTIHCNADMGTAVLSAEIGRVAEDYEPELCRAMLEANYAWGQTGGIGTLCLEPQADGAPEEPVTASVMHQTPVRSLDEASFQAVFDRFLQVAETWSEFLEESQLAAAAATVDDATPME